MMCKYLEKRDASDCGSTVLELLHTSIMCLRMSEMGELAFYVHLESGASTSPA